jgi:hypothetical protein
MKARIEDKIEEMFLGNWACYRTRASRRDFIILINRNRPLWSVKGGLFLIPPRDILQEGVKYYRCPQEHVVECPSDLRESFVIDELFENEKYRQLFCSSCDCSYDRDLLLGPLVRCISSGFEVLITKEYFQFVARHNPLKFNGNRYYNCALGHVVLCPRELRDAIPGRESEIDEIGLFCPSCNTGDSWDYVRGPFVRDLESGKEIDLRTMKPRE